VPLLGDEELLIDRAVGAVTAGATAVAHSRS
jgi:hypothetical protein